jgi:ADP-heptose:LPS heptosyltransferase
VPPLKRKFNSAIWRLKQACSQGYQKTLKFFVDILTEKYWLLDYLPSFAMRKAGVLLIRLDLIGDFVLWLDAARAYRKLYPNQKITLAVNSACADLAKTLPHWDEVIAINVHRLRTDLMYRLRTLVKLRVRKFAVAIQPIFSREFVGDVVLRSTCATERIGYVGDTSNIVSTQKAQTDRWYSKLIAHHPNCKMELSTNAHFVRALGCVDFLSQIPVIAKTVALPATYQFSKRYIVIAPGASWQPRSWPAAHFAALIQQLASQFVGDFVLCGGKDDQALCEELSQKVNASNVINLAGQTSLLELVEIIRGAVLVISNESSPVHLAAATATPSVCILGGGHFGRFMPYTIEQQAQTPVGIPTPVWHEMDCFGCSWKCKFKLEGDQAVPCVAMISVDRLKMHCQALLA